MASDDTLYYVVCQSGYDEGVTLFRVDRSRDRSRWWTSDIREAQAFDRAKAYSTRAKLRFNRPRVVDEQHAKRLDLANRSEMAGRANCLAHLEGP